jgi:hypothetical protein
MTGSVGMSRGGRLAGLFAAVAMVAGALVAGAAPASAHCGTNETVYLYTFDVRMKPEKKVYAVGDVAKFHIKVSRPGRQDPVGLGVTFDPPHQEPAPDVGVGIGMSVGDVFLFGISRTDEKGEAVVPVRIAEYAHPGWAAVDAIAWKTAAETVCATVQETGYVSKRRAIKITP